MPRPIPHFGPPTVHFDLNTESSQATDLIGWWPPLASRGMNTLRDRSSMSIHGAFVGNPTWQAIQQQGWCLDFNGAADYINCSDSPQWDASDDLTVALWVHPDARVGFETVAGRWDEPPNPNNRVWAITFTNLDAIRFDTSDTGLFIGGNAAVTGNNVLTNGVWNHIVCVHDSGATTNTVYVNGISQAIAAGATAGLLDTDIPLHLAHSILFGGFATFYDGRLGDVRISNRPFAFPEVLDLLKQPWDLYKTPMVPRARSPLAFLAERGVLRGAWRGIMRGM
ncbi:hypothetical protein LCGC14_0500580 [marine sediment metagenome]|uniref:LamG-like jellyroll fold domain-containing protein n=1 Tax=marine sediment metagenome TaxID=412755 RepID=A0A0F9S985_9ZZZZ